MQKNGLHIAVSETTSWANLWKMSQDQLYIDWPLQMHTIADCNKEKDYVHLSHAKVVL